MTPAIAAAIQRLREFAECDDLQPFIRDAAREAVAAVDREQVQPSTAHAAIALLREMQEVEPWDVCCDGLKARLEGPDAHSPTRCWIGRVERALAAVDQEQPTTQVAITLGVEEGHPLSSHEVKR